MLFFFSLRGPSVNRAWDYCHGGIVKIEKCFGSQQRLTQTLGLGFKHQNQNTAVVMSWMQRLSQHYILGTKHVSTYVYMIRHCFTYRPSDIVEFDMCFWQILCLKVRFFSF